MKKTEAIARRIMGWKLNNYERWYDYENKQFINRIDFQPNEFLMDAEIVANKMKELGFHFELISETEVYFNDICGKGERLAEAITDAAFRVIERQALAEGHDIWTQMS